MVQISTLLIGLFATFVAFNIMRLTEIPDQIKVSNYREVEVPVTGGIILFFSTGIFLLIYYFFNLLDSSKFTNITLAVVLLALPFLITGLLDDFFGTKGSQGFKGHFQAIRNGKMTTGFIKLLFGIIFAIVISKLTLVSTSSVFWVFIGAVLIAASSNVANLLDLSPGRCSKTYIVFTIPLLFFGSDIAFLVIGLLAFLLIPDLSEQLMLGDSGANFIGALYGIAVIRAESDILLIIVAVIFVALNIISEKISFSKIFQSNTALNAFDNFGRKYK